MKTVGSVAREIALKRSKLILKKVYLPQSGITMHYREQEVLPHTSGGNNTTNEKNNNTRILFFHGILDRFEDFTKVLVDMQIPTNIRILVPEQIGHGHDIEQDRSDPDNFK